MPMDVMPIIPPHTPGASCFCQPMLGTNPPMFVHRAAGQNIRELPAMVHLSDLLESKDHPFSPASTVIVARAGQAPSPARRPAPKDPPARQGRHARRR